MRKTQLRHHRNLYTFWPGCQVKITGIMASYDINRIPADHLKNFWMILPQHASFFNLPRNPNRFPYIVLGMEISHPESPITVHYKFDMDTEKFDIQLLGVYRGTNKQLREVESLLHYLRKGGIVNNRGNVGKKITAKYRSYIERWNQGEQFIQLLSEWEEANPLDDPHSFYKAFYRAGYRRKNDTVSPS